MLAELSPKPPEQRKLPLIGDNHLIALRADQPVLPVNLRIVHTGDGLSQLRLVLAVTVQRRVIALHVSRVVDINGPLMMQPLDGHGSMLIPAARVKTLFFIRLEHHHFPGNGAAAVAVAASGGLHNALQGRQRTVHCVKVQVDSGFNALRCHHQAGQVSGLPLADVLHHLNPVGRAQIRGQEEQPLVGAALLVKQAEQRSGMIPQVDNGAGVTLLQHLTGNVCQGCSCIQPPGHPGAAQLIEQAGVAGQDLRGLPVRNGLEGGLGCGGKDHGAVIAGAKLLHCVQGGGKQLVGQGLRLVKENDAVGDAVEFPAVAWLTGEERLKEFDGGGDDHRHIPAGGEHPGMVVRMALAVILQHVPHNAAVGAGVLLRQRQKRQHHDDPLLARMQAVAQGEVQHGQGFAGAGGGGEGVEPLLAVAHGSALGEHLVAQLIERGVRPGALAQLPAIGIQLLQQRGGVQGRDFLRGGIVRRIIPGGDGVVRIHQAGIQHPRAQHVLQGRQRTGLQPDSPGGEILPEDFIGRFVGILPAKGGVLAGVGLHSFAAADAPIQLFHQHVPVNQPVVMPVHGGDNGMKGCATPGLPVQQRRTADGVIHMAARALQHGLERLAVFAEVMQQPGHGCFLFQADGCAELPGHFADGGQVLPDGDLSAGGVGGFGVIHLRMVMVHGISLVYESSTVGG